MSRGKVEGGWQGREDEGGVRRKWREGGRGGRMGE